MSKSKTDLKKTPNPDHLTLKVTQEDKRNLSKVLFKKFLSLSVI